MAHVVLQPMNVRVVGGAGYVGLITGLGLAQIGHHVVNVDVDQERVSELQAGEGSHYEEGLDTLLRSNLDAGRLHFSTDLRDAVTNSQIVFIAVGTPSLQNGHADLSQVITVAEELAQYINSYKLIVIKSTVPVGTLELVKNILDKEREERQDYEIVSNPEFLREGKGLYDFFYPNRIVIGTNSPVASTESNLF